MAKSGSGQRVFALFAQGLEFRGVQRLSLGNFFPRATLRSSRVMTSGVGRVATGKAPGAEFRAEAVSAYAGRSLFYEDSV